MFTWYGVGMTESVKTLKNGMGKLRLAVIIIAVTLLVVVLLDSVSLLVFGFSPIMLFFNVMGQLVDGYSNLLSN